MANENQNPPAPTSPASGPAQNPPQQPPLGRGRNQNQAESQSAEILPFTVEFSDENCRNFTITTPPLAGQDIRGRWDTSRMAQRPQGMRDLGNAGNRIPSQIPGLRLVVDIRRKKIRLFDPLAETEEGKAVLAKYNAIIKSPGMEALRRGDTVFSAFEAVEHEVDDDQLKTLLYELRRKWDSKNLLMVSGDLPTVKQIESLDGHELYDPSNQSIPGESKPKYKKDRVEFYSRVQAAAGV